MKRRFTRTVAALAAAGMAVTLAACSTDSGEAADGPLTVWIMGDSGANFEQLVEPFTEDAGVEVEVVAIPWDAIDERLTTAVASGSGPDLLQIGLSKLRTFADAGALLALDEHLGDHPGLAADNFPDGVADALQVGGETVSVPWVSDTRVLFYRSDILEENGIDGPPASWQELREDAKALAARGDGQYGYYIPQWDSPLPVIMTWNHSGDIVADGAVDFDTPAFHEAVDLYTGLYADGSVPTNSDFDQTQGFISGIAPMLVSGPYLAKAVADAAPELDGAWGVTMIPGADTKTSVFAGSNLGIWHNTPRVDAALDLLEFLSMPETQLAWYEINGELPAVSAALADSSLTSDPLVQVYTEQLADSKPLPLVPNWDGQTGSDLLAALNAIVLTGADRDATLAELYSKTEGTSVE